MGQQPIIIVGAGPVGLTAAKLLTGQGIPVKVIEKSDGPSKEWRASTFHAGTLELLEETGLTGELMSKGLIADKVQYRDRNKGLFAEFDFNLLKDETKYPFRLQCPQSTYVKVLYDNLKRDSLADIHFNTEVTDFKQDADGVNVTFQTPDGEEVVRTPFLLGADGARSTTRKLLDIPFEGYTLEERFLLVGTPIAFDQFIPDIAYVNYISDPDQFLFILRVPEAWRLLYPVSPGTSDEEAMNDENVQRQLQSVFKTDQHFPIIERMIYRVHQRVADTFYKGRVILMGDAAHINSPMGGLGLNSGVHDSVDLSRRLIRIMNNEEKNMEEELKTYSQVRQKVALDYVRLISEKNTRIMKEKDPEFRLQMQKDLAAEANDDELARKWLRRSSLLSSVREQGIGKPPEEINKALNKV
ncbi:FAD-dependent oxidoreductase [Pseudalkalibacillus sp. A8]|uniref:FAD-dependent oxidoreductase n=1 Tax=Pseudalkalibacillus sp. A8 TaxID=3382641 RepID=UPI0038B577EE